MATHDYVIANGTGAAVRSDLNGALAAIVSNNSSPTQPATMYAYQWWADTTAGLLKIRNSANSAWVTLFQLDGEWSTLPIENGTAAAPSIYFKDSGTDTGFYSPGADQIGISTGGTSRIVVDASGNVNIDSNTFYVDAANNYVGIGTSTPGNKLAVIGTTNVLAGASIRINSTTGTQSSNSGLWLFGNQNTSHYNWLIGSQYNVDGGLEITPSTAVDGSTFSTPTAVFTRTGRVGIGTLTPSKLLHVVGTEAATGSYQLELEGAFNGYGAGITFSSRTSSGGTLLPMARITADGEDGWTTTGSTQDAGLRLYTTLNGTLTENVRINPAGNVGIGTTSPAYQLQVSTDSAGKPSTSTWTIVSDERIKEDIELADLDLCYAAIKAIPLKRYKWRDEIYTAEEVTDRRKLGWIAQDVETVFPKAVGTHDFKYNQVFEETIIPAVEEELDADGNVITPAQPERIEQGDLISEDVIEDCRNLNADQLYAAMYGAVQKLMAKVEALETSNADLIARVAALDQLN